MSIKLFGLGDGCGGWNGSRNLPDGGDTNGGAGGGPDGSCHEKEGGGCGGADGGGEILLLLSFGSGLSFNLSNLFLMAKSTPGGLGNFFISSLAISFFPTSRSFSKEPTIGLSASNVEIFSKTRLSGFCLLKIFLLIGSSFCLKLALLIMPFVR